MRDIKRIDQDDLELVSTQRSFYTGDIYTKVVKESNGTDTGDTELYCYVSIRPAGPNLVIDAGLTWDVNALARRYDVIQTSAPNQEVVGAANVAAVADPNVRIYLFIRIGGEHNIKTAAVGIGDMLVSTGVSGELGPLLVASGTANAMTNRIRARTATAGGLSRVMLCL